LSGQPEGGWFPQEKISIEQAIKAYTLNTAYAGFEEDIKGSLTAGKLMDFVVLSDNLLTMDPDDIKDVTVLTTVVGGKVVYEAN
jgi:predicted amidohydrolase YtcJ